MSPTIWVKPGPGAEPGRVILWDVDPTYPGGEAYIAAPHPGETDQLVAYEVAETPRVLAALGDRSLERATDDDVAAAQKARDAAQVKIDATRRRAQSTPLPPGTTTADNPAPSSSGK